MKQISVLIVSLIIISVISAFVSLGTQTNSNANTKDLPSWSVTVHGDGGYGLLPYATVKIQQGGSDLFDSPKTTDAYGYIYFENNGSAFPNGTYTVRASKSGYSDGTIQVVIANGAPVNPITNVNIGPPDFH